MGIKITLIGAGSGIFSLNLIKDMCLSKYLDGSTLCMMDINEKKLNTAYTLCSRWAEEIGIKFSITKTLDRREALKGADFVIDTAMPGGYDYMIDGWNIAKKWGYNFGGSQHIVHDESFWINFHQLQLMESIYLDMQEICPNAWLILVSNPVMAATTYLYRKYPNIKLIGMCHGSTNARNLAFLMGLDLKKVSYECPGVNHFLWLNRFEYEGKDAFPLLDKWIDEEFDKYYEEHHTPSSKLSPKALDLYRKYGVFPIGDTCVPGGGSWGHFYHTSPEVEKKWNEDPTGWYLDYFERSRNGVAEMERIAFDTSKKVSDSYKLQRSPEPMIPVIEALAFDAELKIVINTINDKGYVEGVPLDFECEVPTIVSARGIQPLHTKPLPKPLQAWMMRDRIAPVNMELYAYTSHSREALIDLICMDPWTKTREQAEGLLNDILDMPFNAPMKEYYK
ncbi:MAG: hypothetical protein J5922_01120 [Clostridia bacterium]|nr:hypothetical protein [Clostridia bacterium]